MRVTVNPKLGPFGIRVEGAEPGETIRVTAEVGERLKAMKRHGYPLVVDEAGSVDDESGATSAPDDEAEA